MSKSIKLSNNVFIDSSSISHAVSGNHRTLKDLLVPINPYVISNDDLNNYVTSGYYYIVSGNSNSPCNYGIMMVLTIAGDTVQIVFAISTNAIYIRTHYGINWTAWRTI